MDTAIREWLSRYLRSEVSLRDFQRWFVPTTWDIDRTDALAARELAALVDLRLAEYTSGFWSEDELRQLLRRAVENQSLEITINLRLPLPQPQLYSTSSRPFRFVFSGALS
jgi:hypothetical protein